MVVLPCDATYEKQDKVHVQGVCEESVCICTHTTCQNLSAHSRIGIAKNHVTQLLAMVAKHTEKGSRRGNPKKNHEGRTNGINLLLPTSFLVSGLGRAPELVPVFPQPVSGI